MPISTAPGSLNPDSFEGFMNTKRTRIRIGDVRLILWVLALAGATFYSSVVAVRAEKRSIAAKPAPVSSTQ
jgi:hypothetical protein